MHLKRLELRGFKTFVAHTSLELQPGITAIVGPNGSGKSNLADALRWVLGEQGLRQLRSKKAQDVIWSGGAGRPPVGMAEVQLTLDNADGWLDIPFGEVTVGRRVLRSGEGEYVINGARVRLRDVTDLLAKGAAGPGGYGLSVDRAVLGQGAVDALLSLRPAERTAVFEDAAGVRPLYNRRDDALRQLEAARANLLRLEDILSEIAPRLPSLKRAAERARRHAELQREYADVTAKLLRRQLETAEAALAASSEATRQAEARRADAAEAYEALRAYLASLQASVRAAEDRVRDAQGKVAGPQERLQRATRREATLAERHAAQEREAAAASRRRAEVAARRAQIAASRDAALLAIREAEAQLAALRAQLQDSRHKSAEAEREQQASAREAGGTRQRLAELEAAAQQRERDLAAARQRLLAAERELERATVDERRHSARGAELAARLATEGEAIARLDAEARRLGAERSRVTAGEAEAQPAATAAREALRGLLDERTRLVARRDALAHVQGSAQAHQEGARAVWSASKSIPGLRAVLLDLLDVAPGFERAAQALLGTLSEALIADDVDAAHQALDAARARGDGATVVARSWVGRPGMRADGSVMERAKEAAGAGWIGPACDKIKGRGPAAEVVAFATAGCAIVADLPSARAALEAVRACDPCAGMRVATLDGVVADLHGLVHLPGEQRASQHLERARELAELEAQLGKLAERVGRAQAEAAAAEDVVARLGRERARLDRELQAASQPLRAAQARLAQLQREHDQLAGEARGLARSREHLASQVESARGALAASPEQPDRCDELRQLREVHAAAQRDADARRAAAARLRGEVHERELAVARAEQALLGAQKELQRADGELAAAGREAAAGQDDGARLAEELEKTAAELRACREEMSREAEALARASAELARAKAARDECARALEVDAGREPELQRAWSAALREEEASKAAVAQARLQVEAVAEQIDVELGVIVEAVRALPVAAEPVERLAARRRALDGSLRHLGAVNPEAAEEYEELAQRHRHLTEQIEDVRTAAHELQSLSDELQGLIDRQFGQVFEQTSESFTRVFRRFFPGGDARLSLRPDSDGATAIDVNVRLPGKRGQDLALLSGGERALVSTALLFALIDARPTPFCLLDEADASLDDANVDRFCSLLREMTEQTQFIVITHNRATMQAASAIFGVTMDRSGASQIVSWKLAGTESSAQRYSRVT